MIVKKSVIARRPQGRRGNLVLLLDCFAVLAMTMIVGYANAQPTPETALCAVVKQAGQAEYVPGVDVHGNQVVPADLSQSLNNDFDMIEIPVEINLIERLGLDIDGGIELKPAVANFRIYQDGRVMYGEQDITQQAYAVCGSADETVKSEEEKETIETQVEEIHE